MFKSKVRGYNDSSGILYNEMNGLRQYKNKNIMYPKSSNAYPMYENKNNVSKLLKSGNDGDDFFNKKGEEKIPDIPNKNLEDGGFKNINNVIEQTKKPIRIKISKKAKKLASSDITELFIQPTEKSSKEMQNIKKFDKFISNLKN
jgi:hypothetical protein